jgi:hypothetical protein
MKDLYSESRDEWERHLAEFVGMSAADRFTDAQRKLIADTIPLIRLILSQISPGGHHGDLAHNASVFGKRWARLTAPEKSAGRPHKYSDEQLYAAWQKGVIGGFDVKLSALRAFIKGEVGCGDDVVEARVTLEGVRGYYPPPTGLYS